jgi:hypothetical protein
VVILCLEQRRTVGPIEDKLPNQFGVEYDEIYSEM